MSGSAEFQSCVLKMMQLHPHSNVLAQRVFERMPLEGFVDAKILLPENGGRFYDSLLSTASCKFILNKFEKEEQLLRQIREEFESVNGTLSGVCEIVNRLNLEKLRNEIGELGGAGHFFGNDVDIWNGGVRDEMEENELKKVLRLLAAGEKKVNLKERSFELF